jgi:hypothetical protein
VRLYPVHAVVGVCGSMLICISQGKKIAIGVISKYGLVSRRVESPIPTQRQARICATKPPRCSRFTKF